MARNRHVSVANENLPASPGQIAHAERVGFPIDRLPRNATRKQLSDLLDAWISDLEATDEQLLFARQLGIEIWEGILFKEVSELINRAITMRNTTAYDSNTLLRVGNTISYGWWPFEITHIDMRKSEKTVTLTPIVDSADASYHEIKIELFWLAKCGEPTQEEIEKAFATAKV